MDDSYGSLIYQWERPHKIYEDNYEDRGFWDPKYRNISQQKKILANSWHYINFPKYPLEHPHIVDIITRF